MPVEGFERANHYAIEGDGVDGILDLTSITGEPLGSLRVDGTSVSGLRIGSDLLGWRMSGSLAASPDLFSTTVTVIVPQVNVATATPESWNGFAVVATHRTNFAGPQGVRGPLTLYDVRPVAGEASQIVS